jgi:hypothetical protein
MESWIIGWGTIYDLRLRIFAHGIRNTPHATCFSPTNVGDYGAFRR